MASSMELADAVQTAAEVFALEEGLDRNAAHFLGVALREALVNAILHGNKNDSERRVQVRLGKDRRRNLVFTIRDEGAGFEPSRVPDPLKPENLCRGSGRGLFYMKRFADEVRLSFPKKGGTLVELKKRLPGRRRAGRTGS